MWWVLVVAGLGWLFDVMDQRIFVLSRSAALAGLLSVRVDAGFLARIEAVQVPASEAERVLGAMAGVEPGAAAAIEPAAAERPHAQRRG
jgi:hypothetical protein